MPQEIKTITLPMPLRMGDVNCFLVESDGSQVLVDAGTSGQRRRLEAALIDAGCTPESLKLIVITHGDFDHTGSAAALSVRFEAPIAMHRSDSAMASTGDMFANRRRPIALMRVLARWLFSFGKGSRFEPDVFLEDGDSLAAYGLDAEIVSIPGHSQGSIGILTAEGALFCGDLLENKRGPALNSLMDDRATAEASLRRLVELGPQIETVYPGHGGPFPATELRRLVS